jgi:hypothetical protein
LSWPFNDRNGVRTLNSSDLLRRSRHRRAAVVTVRRIGAVAVGVDPEHRVPLRAAGAAAARVETRIKELHAHIGVTQVEAARWDKFDQVMRDNASDMDRILSEWAQRFPSMNALQDMQSYQQVAEAHAQHLQKLVAVFQQQF